MKIFFLAIFAALLFRKLELDIVIDVADDEYDFIVVGGGNTGSVVASRLSEDEHTKVLLLEAGKSDAFAPDVFVPGKMRTLPGTIVDWNYTCTTSQRGEDGLYHDKVARCPRGKVLGGSSSINYMDYVRGSPHDYDSWEDHGARGWDSESVEHIFHKIENAKSPKMSKKLGRNGPLFLTRNHLETSTFRDIITGAANDFGIKRVDNIENMEGLSHVTRTVYKGLRQNAATAYLRPIFPQRKDRLHILTNALVTRILFDEGKKAYAVQYAKGGKSFVARARKEIILSAGAFGTPHLLMLSGIGPKDELQKFNISVVEDLPGVGSNLQDHPVIGNTFVVEKVFFNNTEENAEMQYIKEGKGKLAESSTLHVAARTPLFDTPTSSSSRKRPFPDIITIIMENRPKKGNMKINWFVILTHPKSRGTVRLRSANPRDLPIIDLNTFSHEDDIKLAISGLRLLEKWEKTNSFVDYGLKYEKPGVCGEAFSQEVPRKEEFYRCLINQTSRTINHASCTAKIGQRSDRNAVVDHELRVYGVSGLRVADASVMPHIITIAPQATCYMIGEKAADMIKKKWMLQ